MLTNFLFRVSLSLITSISIYGYSFTILFPILLICLIPIEILKVICFGYGLLHSTIFLIHNLFVNIEKKANLSKYIIVAITICFQIALYSVLKFYFYANILDKNTIKDNSINY